MSLSRELTLANREETSTSDPAGEARGCTQLLKTWLPDFACLFFQGKGWGRAGSSEAQDVGLVPKKTKSQGFKALN